MNRRKCQEQMLRQKDAIAQALTAMNIPYQYNEGEWMYFDARQSGVGFLSCFKQLIYISDHEEVVCDAIFPVRPPRRRAVYDRLLRLLNDMNLSCCMEGAHYLLEYKTGDLILRVTKCCGEEALPQQEYMAMILCGMSEFSGNAQRLLSAMWTTPLALGEPDEYEAFEPDDEEGFPQEGLEDEDEEENEDDADVLRFLVRRPRERVHAKDPFDLGDGAQVEAQMKMPTPGRNAEKKKSKKKHKKKKKSAWDEDKFPF